MPVTQPPLTCAPFEPGVLVENHQDLGPVKQVVVLPGAEGTRPSAAGASLGPQNLVIAEWLRAATALRSPVSRMQAVIGMAMETGPWTAGSISVLEPGATIRTFAYLDARAAECDRLQREIGEGPAHDAVHLDLVQAATNLTVDHRWSRWSPMAIDLGINRVLALRLFTNSTSGILNLYARRPGEIDSRVVRNAEVLAAHASILLEAIITEDGLRRGTFSRGLIGQAQGIQMHKYGINAAEAFAVLRSTSQQHNIKIVTLAEQFIATGTLPKPHHPKKAK